MKSENQTLKAVISVSPQSAKGFDGRKIKLKVTEYLFSIEIGSSVLKSNKDDNIQKKRYSS